MRQPAEYGATSSDRQRNILWVAYILHVLSIFTVWLTSAAGVIINHVKYAEATDPLIASHHRWLVRTFWFALVWNLVCIPLALLFIGFAGFVIVAVWFVYRLVRGILALADNKPMPMPDSIRLHDYANG